MISIYDLEKDLNYEFNHENRSDLYYHDAIGREAYPEQRSMFGGAVGGVREWYNVGGAYEVGKAPIRATFGLAGGVASLFSHIGSNVANRPLMAYAGILGEAAAATNRMDRDEKYGVLGKLSIPGMSFEAMKDVLGKMVEDVDDIPMSEMDDMQKFLAVSAEGAKNISRWFKDRQESTKVLGVEISAPDPELFSGDFMDNPSLTRAMAAVSGAIPSLASVAISSVATGGVLPAIMLLGASTAGSTMDEAEEAGASQATTVTAGLISGVVEGVLEMMGAKALGLEGGAKAMFKNAKVNRAFMIGKGIFSEGLEEGTQTVAQNIIAKVGYDKSRELFQGVVEAIIAGGGSGGIIGSLGPNGAKVDKVMEEVKKNGVTQEEIDEVIETVKDVVVEKGGDIDEVLGALINDMGKEVPPTADEFVERLASANVDSVIEGIDRSQDFFEDDPSSNVAGIFNTDTKIIKIFRRVIEKKSSIVGYLDISDVEFSHIIKDLNYDLKKLEALKISQTEYHEVAHYLLNRVHGINNAQLNAISKDIASENGSDIYDDDFITLYHDLLESEEHVADLYALKKNGLYDIVIKNTNRNVDLDKEVIADYFAKLKIFRDAVIKGGHLNVAPDIDRINEGVNRLFSFGFGKVKTGKDNIIDEQYRVIEDAYNRELDSKDYKFAMEMKRFGDRVNGLAKKIKMTPEALNEILTATIEFRNVKSNPLDKKIWVNVDEFDEEGIVKVGAKVEDRFDVEQGEDVQMVELTLRQAMELKYSVEQARALSEHVEKLWKVSRDINDGRVSEDGVIKGSEGEIKGAQRKIVELAMELEHGYNGFFDMMVEMGIIEEENRRANYTSREYVVAEGLKKPKSKGKKTTRHTKSRTFDTYADALARGYVPKTLNASQLFFNYGNEINGIVANGKFLHELRQLMVTDDSGNRVRFISKEQHEGYEKLNSPLFQDTKKVVNADGNGHKNVRVPLYAPKQYARYINNMLDQSKLVGIGVIDNLSYLNAQLKSVRLLSSLFHHMAFFNSYMFGVHGKYKHGGKFMNPFQAYKEGLRMYDEEHPTVQLGIANGLTFDKVQDWENKLLQKKTKLGRILDNNKYSKEFKDRLNGVREQYVNFLFGKWGKGLKAASFYIEYKHYRGKESWSHLSDNEVAQKVAEFVNDDFGGLHHRRMKRNQTLQHIMQFALLGPDWTESNVNTIWKAFRKGEDGEIYRRFWLGAVINIGIVTTLLNMFAGLADRDEDRGAFERVVKGYINAFNSGKLNVLKAHIDPLFELVGYETSDDHYLNVGGHFLDPLKWITRDIKKGKGIKGGAEQFIDPNRMMSSLGKTAYYKSSMLVKPIADFIKGTDYTFYRKFTDVGQLVGAEDVPDKPGNSRVKMWKNYNEKGHMVTAKQFPSFLAYEAYQSLPVMVVLLNELFGGDASLIDTLPRIAGFDVSKTYPKPTYKSKKKKEVSYDSTK